MPKVLIVDDDRGIRTLIRESLTARGHEVVEAADGLEGLRAIDQESPDVVLLDIVMPRMVGWQVLEILQGRPGFEELAVVIITTLADQDTEARARRLGAASVLTKPFDLADLDEAVRSALGKGR